METTGLTASTVSVIARLWRLRKLVSDDTTDRQRGTETYWDNERDVYFTRLGVHLLLAVDDVALDVVDGQVVETVLVVVPHHAAVVDAAVPTVGVAAVLGQTVVVQAGGGGGEKVSLLLSWQRDGDVELGLVVVRVAHVIGQPDTLQLRPCLASLDHQVGFLSLPPPHVSAWNTARLENVRKTRGKTELRDWEPHLFGNQDVLTVFTIRERDVQIRTEGTSNIESYISISDFLIGWLSQSWEERRRSILPLEVASFLFEHCPHPCSAPSESSHLGELVLMVHSSATCWGKEFIVKFHYFFISRTTSFCSRFLAASSSSLAFS